MSAHGQALDARDATDRAAWLAAWRRCGREPFAHPAYVELMCRATGERAACYWWRSDGQESLLPFVVRPVPATDGPLRDAASPYGYGGPWTSGPAADGTVWDEALGWMRDEGLLTFFGRLGLFAPGPVDPALAGDVTAVSDNVVVDLTRPPDAQWRHYAHKVRKNVQKARRGGLTVDVRPWFTDVEEFADLYTDTMRRRDAAAFYRFDAGFFDALGRALPESVLAAEVRTPDGTLVSAELALAGDASLYSFLGGTRTDAFRWAPNDLLKHALVDAGRETGRTRFVLGGGYAPDDGILRYKASFDPTGRRPFRTLRAVLDAPAYAGLCGTGPPEEGYFPAYRRPHTYGATS